MHRSKTITAGRTLLGGRRWRRRRILWLTAGAFVTSGTIASIPPPAYSPTFASPPATAAGSISSTISEKDALHTPGAAGRRSSATASGKSATNLDVTNSALGKRLLGGVRLEDTLQALAASGPSGHEPSAYEVRLARVTGVIEQSLFDDGQAAGLSDRLIMELADIFGWDIDFVVDLRRGDRFTVLYEEKYWRGRKVADGDIIAAEFVNQSRTFRAIGHRVADGRMEYYSPDGLALRRAFLRTPVKFSRVSSTFSDARYHPILKRWRAHNGVDYDAPLGTPVRATASGRIAAIGWNGGYGNIIAIRHAGPYSTVYAHLARYRPGLRAGQMVAQGEIIGYVGRTGLATAPHLHYEVQVNGVQRDPLTFELPTSARTPVPVEWRRLFFKTAALMHSKLKGESERQLAYAP